MNARKILALGLALLIFGGCGATLKFEAFKDVNPKADITQPGLYYVEAAGGFGTAALNAIIYKMPTPDKDGRDVIIIASGVEQSVWASILKIAVGGAFFVAGNAVYGLSLEAARTIVNQAVTAAGGSGTGGSATGGSASGGTATATGQGGAGGSATTGSVTATGGAASTGAISNTNTATGGAGGQGGSATNTNTNTNTNLSCSAGGNMAGSNCKP